MRTNKTGLIVLGLLLVASPALASKHVASCDKIRAALDGGKTEKQVAKSMKTSVSHVKHCATQQANASGSTTAK
jgi:hypothetical protein